MRRKIEVILICLLFLTVGCQKEELYQDKQEKSSEFTNLQLLNANDPIVNDIMGSSTKSVNDKVDLGYPWLLDMEDDKERVTFFMKSEDRFSDRRMVYVKDGDKRFNYIVERAYVYSNVDDIENLDVDSKVNFTGILTIYSADNLPLHSYFYMNNELVGETVIDQYAKGLKTGTKSGEGIEDEKEPGNFPNLLKEVKVVGDAGSKNLMSDLWFLENSGRYINYNRGTSNDRTNYLYDDDDDRGGSSTANTNNNDIGSNGLPMDQNRKVLIHLQYLRIHEQAELAKIFSTLLQKPDLTKLQRAEIYDALEVVYLDLMKNSSEGVFPEKLYSEDVNKGDIFVLDKEVINIFSQSVSPKGLVVSTWGFAIYDIVRNASNKPGIPSVYSSPLLLIQMSMQLEDWTRANILHRYNNNPGGRQGLIMRYTESVQDFNGYLHIESCTTLIDAATGMVYGTYGQNYLP
ncbi:hypothetical protein EO244_03415 [Ancylomarina salipaludis]|uniref:Uncharacterized protein n=1 Tax=Ancylomarina salipaludis TaxID=2501299 RepID=A0A4Q1JP48_9BACT|nr:hypothetical protein [Ancylomarina salipaludis]RXQ96690.1 hypothetical protein EO244_03415 [Ancylomarina salipaludis]